MTRARGRAPIAPAACILVLALLLTGCGSPAPKLPDVVRVPVPIACLEETELPPRPQFLAEETLLGLPDYLATALLWLERRARIVYQAQLEAAVAQCWRPKDGGT